MTAVRCLAVAALLGATLPGCGREEPPAVAPPGAAREEAGLQSSLIDLMPSQAGLALALPTLGEGLEGFMACLGRFEREPAARQWIERYLGGPDEYAMRMAAHGVDPNGPGILFLDARPLAQGNAALFAGAFRCVYPDRFESLINSEQSVQSSRPIPHIAAGEWMIAGNDEDMTAAVAEALRAVPASSYAIADLSGDAWCAVVYPGRVTPAIRMAGDRALTRAPDWIRDALAPTLDHLPMVVEGDHVVEVVISLGEQGVQAALTFDPSEHPALRGWLGEPVGPPIEDILAEDDLGAVVGVRLTGVVRVALENVISAAAAETRDADAMDAAKILTETLGGDAFLVTDAGVPSNVKAVGWAVTDETRARTLAHTMLPPKPDGTSMGYSDTRIDEKLAGIPIAVTVGHGYVLVARDLDTARRMLDVLAERQDLDAGDGEGCRLVYSGPWPLVSSPISGGGEEGDAVTAPDGLARPVRIHAAWTARPTVERIHVDATFPSSRSLSQ